MEGVMRGRRVERVGYVGRLEGIVRGPPVDHTYRELVCGVEWARYRGPNLSVGWWTQNFRPPEVGFLACGIESIG
jgi:hypothetical protein